jgi:hypothetical protein
MTILSETEVKHAQALMGHVIQLFAEAEELAQKYTGKEEDLMLVDEASDGRDDIGKLCQKMRHICLQRQRGTSAAKKAKWSLYTKEKFGELVNNMHTLIDDLVDLFPSQTPQTFAMKQRQRELCDQEAKEMREEVALPKLQTVALKQDQALAEAIARLATKSVSHPRMLNVFTTDRTSGYDAKQHVEQRGQHQGPESSCRRANLLRRSNFFLVI